MQHTIKTIIDSDNYFTIDPITRTIDDSSSDKKSIMQYDHNSEIFTFKMPRTVEGHDMLECDAIEIHYVNKGQTNSHPDVYEVKDVYSSEDFIVFSWLINNHATQYTGDLTFQIKFICYSEDYPTVPDYTWSTRIYSAINVLPGINNASVVVETNSDILESWELRLFSLSAEGVTNINTAKVDALDEIESEKTEACAAVESKGLETLATIPADYSNLFLEDICPALTTARTNAGVTYTPTGDGGYTMNGTVPSGSSSYCQFFTSATDIPNNFEPGGKYAIDFYHIDKSVKFQVRYANAEGAWTYIYDKNISGVFEIPSDAVGLNVRLYVGSGHTVNHLVRPKIYKEGSMAYKKFVKDKKPQAMLTIIYDDGHNDFYDYILPLIKSKNVPISTAIMADKVGINQSLMEWDKISECYVNGAEVLPHCMTKTEDEWNDMGAYGIANHYMKQRNLLANNGLDIPDTFMFAGGSSEYAICREGCSKVFSSGFAASVGETNFYGQIDPYYIKRYGTDNKNLATLKSWIDNLVGVGTGWMVWMRHNSNTTTEDQTTATQILSDAIDYAIEKGIPIVTVERGLAEYLS